MSLNSIIGNAASGLQAAQTTLRVVSDNVANVDTPGYVRKVVDQTSLTAGGQGSGVTAAAIRRVTDQFLQAAGLKAASDSGAASISASTLDQAQSLFGDPSTDGSFFSGLDKVFSGFNTLAASNTTANAASAVGAVQTYFAQAKDVANGLSSLSGQTDQRLSTDVTKINALLGQIDHLNSDIARAVSTTGDATGLQDQQSQLIDSLSALIDVKVSPTSQGGVIVRGTDGFPLAGQGGAATLRYDGSGALGQLFVSNGAGTSQPFGGRIASGEVKGLLDLRNTDLPNALDALSELVSATAAQLNTVHNAGTAWPPPTSLTGRNTGLDAATAASGFTGKTTIALVSPTGTLDQKLAIDFSAGTISVNGGAATGFTPATFVSALNTAFGGTATVTFANGALSVKSASTDGIAIADDAAAPATKAGQGFSAFFGLNDLVRSSTFTNYNTGLSPGDASGYPAGQSLSLKLSDASGATLRDVNIATPAGATVADLLAALNASPGGVGQFGAFSLDSKGALGFTANTSGASVLVLADNTARGAGGPSLSALFGIGQGVRAARAGTFTVDSGIAANPRALAIGRLDPTVAVGAKALSSTDVRGADALGQAGTSSTGFAATGGSSASTSTLSNYAATLSSAIARKAAAASDAKTAAASVASEASTRRSSVEGVNLDDELVKLTTYQQAYNASARLVQAAKDMYDTLLGMTR